VINTSVAAGAVIKFKVGITIKYELYFLQRNIKYPTYTGCNRKNGPDFGRVFLRSNYNDITQNTYTQRSMFTEILAREI